ncbi:hypothetical protein [[Enterobacter] lignolyticus]|uniref:Uncharacterized protein n=1 Tax=Enterobacter lignolyticus (strain SCF1) TaxID=701347 RepID=E3GBA7_ENTLS|nr:hypothetical protein [[Enterobacter] lignolyticus]ADO48870.1 hypothetical protein Entcl_2620 [[Enterobacter] lignolyticus SCF1]
MKNDADAINDILVSYVPDPQKPGESFVFLTNKNKGRDILVRVRVTGSSSFKIYDLKLAKSNSYDMFPHEFELIIKTGLTNYIGKDIFDHSLMNSGHEKISVQYNVKGALYIADSEVSVPPPDVIIDYLRYYIAQPNNESIYIYAINMNHVFRMIAHVSNIKSSNEWWGEVDFVPFGGSLIHTRGVNDPQYDWKIDHGEFKKYTSPI